MKSEGYWVRLRTGRWIEVRDHAMAVKAEPRRFGLTLKNVRGLSPFLPRDHDLLRLLTMRMGWLRVRSSSRGEVSAEFWCGTTRAAARVLGSFLRKLGFGGLTWITLKNLKRRTGLEDSLQRLMAATPGARAFKLDAASKRKLDALQDDIPWRGGSRERRRHRLRLDSARDTNS